MGDSHNWRDLLYPAEWGFRFFITTALVWLIGWQWHEPVAMAIFYALVVGVVLAFALQLHVLIAYIRRNRFRPAERRQKEDCTSGKTISPLPSGEDGSKGDETRVVGPIKTLWTYFFNRDWVIPFFAIFLLILYAWAYGFEDAAVREILSFNLTISTILLSVTLAALAIIGSYTNTLERKKRLNKYFKKIDFSLIVLFPVLGIFAAFYTMIFSGFDSIPEIGGLDFMVLLSSVFSFLSIFILSNFSTKLIELITDQNAENEISVP